MEIVGPKSRPMVGSLVGSFWALGLAALPWPAYLIRTWRWVQLACCLPSILGLAAVFVVPESPRWLYSQNRSEEGNAIVRRIAKFNGKEIKAKLDIKIKDSQNSATLIDIFRSTKLRLRLIILCLLWCIIAMIYYAILLNASRFEGDDFMNFSIGGFVEMGSTVFAFVALKFLPRRVNLCGLLSIAGVSLVAILFTPKAMHGLVLTFVMIGRFGIASAFFSIYVISAEVYPTVVRAVGISSCSVFARVGGIVAPFIGALISINIAIPFVIFGVCSLIGALLGLVLPETKDVTLPETIEDGENMGGLWCFSRSKEVPTKDGMECAVEVQL